MSTDWNDRIVGNYRIVDKIGEGGMGAVYLAVDQMLDREVALKAIRPSMIEDAETVQRFRTEAKLAARLSHPAIATIYSFFEEPPELFLAMEYVRGETLSHVLARRGPLPWPEAVRIVTAALAGVAQAHRAGVIHRDLKPDNLMILDDPGDGQEPGVKVMDFGIARSTEASRLTRTGHLVGTTSHMAPEQILGEAVDPRTDLYSLGIVLYEALTGRTPFQGGSDFAILKAQIENPPASPRDFAPDLPPWLERAVLKALAKSPKRRFQSADEMRQALTSGATALIPPASNPALASSPGWTPPAPAGRRLAVRAVAVLAVLALAGLGIFLAVRFRAAPRPEERAAAADREAPAPAARPAAPVRPAPVPPPAVEARPSKALEDEDEKDPRDLRDEKDEKSPAKPPRPRGSLASVSSGIVDTGSELYAAYQRFLGEKKKSGRKITATDQQLRLEIARFEDTADGIHYATRGGVFTGLRRLRGENASETHQRIGRLLTELKKAERKIEPLMDQVRPNPQVRELWRQIRQQVREAEALARR